MHSRIRARIAAAVAGVAALALVAAASTPIEQTDAAWIDREYASANLSVATLPAPDFRCASTGGLLTGPVGFVWNTPATPYTGAVLQGYTLSYGLVGSAPSTTVNLGPGVTTYGVPASGLVLLSSYTVTLTARYTNWVSPPTSRTINVLLGALGTNTYGCG